MDEMLAKPAQHGSARCSGEDDRSEGDARGEQQTSKLAPGLHVVATPIGNLGDITRRAASVLAEVDLVICEDTRVTGRLLSHLGISNRLAVYNDHNAPAVRPHLLARLARGEALALVTDAGTPCISDPGYRLVRAALDAGITVRSVPGPSAPIAALSIAGLPTDRFLFAGFLPPKPGKRRTALGELATVRATLVVLETGPRLAESLADAAAVLGARPAVVAREITKLHEALERAPLMELAQIFAERGPPKGEIVLIIGPPEEPAASVDPADVDRQLRAALATMKPRAAAKLVAEATGLSATELYQRILALRDGAQEH